MKFVKKCVFNCPLKDETNEHYKLTTVCVVLANCIIAFSTVQKSSKSLLLDSLSVYMYTR